MDNKRQERISQAEAASPVRDPHPPLGETRSLYLRRLDPPPGHMFTESFAYGPRPRGGERRGASSLVAAMMSVILVGSMIALAVVGGTVGPGSTPGGPRRLDAQVEGRPVDIRPGAQAIGAGAPTTPAPAAPAAGGSVGFTPAPPGGGGDTRPPGSAVEGFENGGAQEGGQVVVVEGTTNEGGGGAGGGVGGGGGTPAPPPPVGNGKTGHRADVKVPCGDKSCRVAVKRPPVSKGDQGAARGETTTPELPVSAPGVTGLKTENDPTER